MNTGLEMTHTNDPMIEILLERSRSRDDQPISPHKAMIETLRSIQLANFVYTNTILDLVTGDGFSPNRPTDGSSISGTQTGVDADEKYAQCA